MSAKVPRNTRWSWRALVRQYGEEVALVVLEGMPGVGLYADSCRQWSDGTEDPPPPDDLHDEVPALPVTTLADLDAEWTSHRRLFTFRS